MVDYEDYFGDSTEEEYTQQSKEHFEWLKNHACKFDGEIGRCCMSRYCKHSLRGYCIADDETLKECPYLEAIGEIARLSVELAMKE